MLCQSEWRNRKCGGEAETCENSRMWVNGVGAGALVRKWGDVGLSIRTFG